ncbi:MAG TPA: formate dehydrogenase accessory sulfurtransferase FdhD [Desulfomonilia bacterium]|nr:formate dehydrogenase accessory sulfurtransferase FdhD [Desulfomonilia bacterium]
MRNTVYVKESIETLLGKHDSLCLHHGSIVKRPEMVCLERVIHLYLNDKSIGSLVASPSQLRELGAGFVISEGLAGDIEDVVAYGNEVKVYGGKVERRKRSVTGSSGGISFGKIIRKIDSNLTIEQEDIFLVIAGIVSELWEKTGGAHCSVLFSGRKIVAKSSDVGRHNTVDKVIGSCVLNGIDPSACVLGCTGRQPAGMVSKAINAGIPIIISKAATTDEGIKLAEEAGLTLVCRVKEDRFCVYSHPWRIRDLAEEESVTG